MFDRTSPAPRQGAACPRLAFLLAPLALACLVLALAASAQAGTILPTYIHDDQVWTAAGNPYQVQGGGLHIGPTEGGDPIVDIVIGPGVEVIVPVGSGIQFGSATTLLAEGSTSEPIRFRPGPETNGVEEWTMLDLQGSATLRNVSIESAGLGGNPAVMVWGSAVSLEDCRILDAAHAGVAVIEGATASIDRCEIHSSGTDGVYTSHSTLFVNDSTIEGSGALGLHHGSYGTIEVRGTTFRDNALEPLAVPAHTILRDNVFDGNGVNDIVFQTWHLGGDRLWQANVDIATGDPIRYRIPRIWVETNTLTIEAGAILANEDGDGLVVHDGGTLVAAGTSAQPILFTGHAGRSWCGLDFAPAATVVFRNVTVEDAGACNGGSVWLHGPHTLEDCIIRDSRSSGVYVYAVPSGARIARCTIEHNAQHGITTYSSHPLIEDSVLRGNGWSGVSLGGYSDITLLRDHFESNGYGDKGYRPIVAAITSVLVGNTFDQNAMQEIDMVGGNLPAGITRSWELSTDMTSGERLSYHVYWIGVQGSLTLPPGVTLHVADGIAVHDGAHLSIDGTTTMPIQLLPFPGTTWCGLDLGGAASVTLRNFTLASAGRCSGAAIMLSGAHDIEDCVVRDSRASAVYAVNVQMRVARCTFEDNAVDGIVTSNAEVTVEDSIFRGNAVGVHVGTGHATLRGNKLVANDVGLRLDYGGATAHDNVFSNPANLQNHQQAFIGSITPVAGTNIVGGAWIAGNAWSDYAGEDLDGDGLGDTLVPHAGGDMHPLVTAAPPPPPPPPARSFLATLLAQLGSLQDSAAIGAQTGATSSYDSAHDLAEPPAPPTETYARFYVVGASSVPELQRSVIAPAERMVFDLVLQSRGRDTTGDGIADPYVATVSWAPADFSALGGCAVLLETSAGLVDMEAAASHVLPVDAGQPYGRSGFDRSTMRVHVVCDLPDLAILGADPADRLLEGRPASVLVRIGNVGASTALAATMHWAIDGVWQTPIGISTPAPGDETVLQLHLPTDLSPGPHALDLAVETTPGEAAATLADNDFAASLFVEAHALRALAVPDALFMVAGDTADISIEVTNDGNAPTPYAIAWAIPEGWTATILADVGELAPGETGIAVIRLGAPSNGPASRGNIALTFVTSPTADPSKEAFVSVVADLGVVVTLSLPGEGWHLVSVPVVPRDASPSAVFAGVDAVYAWDGAGYVEPTQIELGVGYWVYTGRALDLEVAGTPESTMTRGPLDAGWHLVGAPSVTTTLVAAPAEAIEEMLYAWGAGGYAAIPSLTVEPGRGYWVFVLADGTRLSG